MSSFLKKQALLISGVSGFLIPTWFAWTLYVSHASQNVATWGMVFVLDMLGLILAFKGGNKEPYMQLGWALAAGFVFIAVFLSGNQTVWGWTETASVILCGVAITLWVTKGPLVALWAYMAALYISFTPLAVDYWKEPQLDTLWVWLLSSASCLFAILGAKTRDFREHIRTVGRHRPERGSGCYMLPLEPAGRKPALVGFLFFTPQVKEPLV